MAGAEKQGWGFGRNEATVRAARRGLEDEPQGDEAGFEFVPGQIFRRRDFQETGQQFFLLRHRQNQMQLKFSRSVLQADNKLRETPRTPAEVRLRVVAGGQRIERWGRRFPNHDASRSVNCSRSPHGTGTMSYCLSDVSTPAGMPSALFKSTKHSDAAGRVSRVSIQLKANCLA